MAADYQVDRATGHIHVRSFGEETDPVIEITNAVIEAVKMTGHRPDTISFSDHARSYFLDLLYTGATKNPPAVVLGLGLVSAP